MTEYVLYCWKVGGVVWRNVLLFLNNKDHDTVAQFKFRFLLKLGMFSPKGIFVHFYFGKEGDVYCLLYVTLCF